MTLLLFVLLGVVLLGVLLRKSSPARGQTAAGRVRFIVHRTTFLQGCDAQLEGTLVQVEAHHQLFGETRLDAAVVLEGQTDQSVTFLTDVSIAKVLEAKHLESPTAEQTMREAMVRRANAELAALPFEWAELTPGVFACCSADQRAADRLLRTEVFSTLPFPRDRAVVMVPDLDTVLVADATDDAALAAMLDAAVARFTGDHWLTLDTLGWVDDGWHDLTPGADEALQERFERAQRRGQLTAFHDLAATCDFPPARSSVVGPLLWTTWVAGTTVVVPDRFDGDIDGLRLVDPRDEVEALLRGAQVDAFLSRTRRDAFLGHSIVDQKCFPPAQVRAVLAAIDEVEDQEEVELPLEQVLPLIITLGAVVLPSRDDGPVEVWLADGRFTTLPASDQGAALAVLPEPARSWSQSLVQHADLEGNVVAVTETYVAVAAHLQAKNGEAALAALETALKTTPLTWTLVEMGLKLAVVKGDPTRQRDWARRLLDEKPSMNWRARCSPDSSSSRPPPPSPTRPARAAR